MALIKCYECNQPVSSDAKACPKCGGPIGKSIQKANAEAQAQKSVQSCMGWGCLIVLGGIFGLCLLGALISLDTTGTRTTSSSSYSKRTSSNATTSSVSARKLIRNLESFGMKQDIPWKKSRVENGWIAQIRCYVDSNGNKTLVSDDNGDLFNELNCQLTGPTESYVKLVEIEAEIYDTKTESQTLDHGSDLLGRCFPDCPDEIVKSFKNGESKKSNNWEITKIKNDAGHELRLTYRPTVKKPAKNVNKQTQQKQTKKSGGDEGMAWVMAQSFVKKTLKSPSSASFGSVFNGDWQNPDDVTKHLGDDKYRISTWVDAQNSFGATIRKEFTCVVKKNGDNTWSCQSVNVDD